MIWKSQIHLRRQIEELFVVCSQREVSLTSKILQKKFFAFKMAFCALKIGGHFLAVLLFDAFQEYCRVFYKSVFCLRSYSYIIKYGDNNIAW